MWKSHGRAIRLANPRNDFIVGGKIALFSWSFRGMRSVLPAGTLLAFLVFGVLEGQVSSFLTSTERLKCLLIVDNNSKSLM
jgi:hypothetical protein